MTARALRRKRVDRGIRVIDDFTDTSTMVGSVTLEETASHLAAVPGPSGFYYFRKLPESAALLSVRAEYYVDQAYPLTPPRDEQRVLTIRLLPNWRYPFPPGATVIRGAVTSREGQPLAGAQVEIKGTAAQSRTAADGRFAVYLRGLTEDDVLAVAHRAVIKGLNGDGITKLRTRCSGYRTKTISIRELDEGQVLDLAEPIALTKR